MKTIIIRIIAMITLMVVIATLGLLARKYTSMQWLVENETRMREFVREQPWQAFFLGFFIFTAFSLVPGTVGKSVLCGWLFGFWQAVLLVDIGLTIAAMVSFMAARFITRETVVARLGRLVGKLDRAMERDGAFILLMMRLAHVPYSVVNYVSGATSVPLRTFWWTTLIGVLPGTAIFVFIGTRIPTLASIADQGVRGLLDPLLFAAMFGTVAFPVLARRAFQRKRKRDDVSTEIELEEFDSYSGWFPGTKANGH